MNAQEPDLRRQVADLSDRLARVERRLGLAPGVAGSAGPVGSPEAMPAKGGLRGLISLARQGRAEAAKTADSSDYGDKISGAPSAPAGLPKAPPTSPVPIPPGPSRSSSPIPVRSAGAGTAAPGTEPPPTPDQRTGRGAPREPAFSGIAAVERLIGGRWYAVIGAIVVVIGVALFFRLALQQGWLVISPAARCITGGVFGGLLLVAGELARRKINAMAAAGLNAAGIGVAYASVFAAYGFYEGLLAEVPAFALLAGVAALGIVIGARARQLSVAIVSLLCGYLTPILLSQAQPRPMVLPVYWLTLLVVGLGLSSWRGGTFVALRSLVWWATLIFGTFWSLRFGTREPVTTLVFLALAWSAVHAELAISSGRFGLVPGAGGNVPDEEIEGPLQALAVRERGLGAWRPLSSSFSTTAWAALLGTLLLRRWLQGPPDWIATAGLAAGSGMLSMVLAGHLRVLRDRPQTDAQRLGACLVVQSGALIIAAAALAVHGPAQALFWLAMGVAVVMGGRWIGSRGLDVYGLVVLALATGRTLVWESWAGTLPRTGFAVAGLHLTLWAALMGAVAAGWLVTAYLLRRSAEPGSAWRRLSNAAVSVGLTLVGIALQHEAASAVVPLVTMATLGAAVGVAGARLGSQGLRGYAFLVLAAAMAYAGVERWWSVGAGAEGLAVLGLRLTGWTAGLMWLAGAWWLTAQLSLRATGAAWAYGAVGAAAAGVAAAMAAVVHESAAGSAVVVAWLLMALAVGAGRFFENRLALERIGLAGLVAAAVAWAVVYPFWGETWRSGGFVAGLHPGLWIGLGLAAGFGVFGRVLLANGRGAPLRGGLRAISAALAGVLVFAATTLEVGRSAVLLARDLTVQRAAVSVWWGVFAFGLIALGFAVRGRARHDPAAPRGIPLCRQAGLALLGVAALKALIFDLGDVDQLGRVISIVGVGLLMLAVSVTYAKVSAKVAAARGGGPVGLP